MIEIPDMCSCCGKSLTDEESEYYGFRCEACEREWHDRMVAWRNGGDDPELDALYGLAINAASNVRLH